MNQQANPPRRAPLARLIENPDQSAGAPPFALTDQTGTIQRFVEPEPGIDLIPHVGQIVAVRHDSGPTLLASQLELPRQPLYPMVAAAESGPGAYSNSLPFQAPQRFVGDSKVTQAQYVDNDDASVQLLPDDGAIPEGMAGGPGYPGQLPILGESYPGYPGQMGPMGPMMPGQMGGPGYGPPCCDSQCCDPMQCGPGGMQPYADPMMGPCPQCGQFHNCSGAAQASPTPLRTNPKELTFQRT